MAKILTIECGDDGVLVYRLAKPTMKRLEAAQSVLAALEVAVPKDDDHAKVFAAHGAMISVMEIFKVDEDDGGDQEGETVADQAVELEQAEPGNNGNGAGESSGPQVETRPSDPDHHPRTRVGRRHVPASNGGETL